jgi:aminoglycoside phosphotransferase (APT) family kinase protein
VRLLETGFGSVAVETSGGAVFRIARHRGPANGHATELRALPALRGRLPAPIPDPKWRIEPGEGPFERGGIGYETLTGEQLSPELTNGRLAAEIGEFFAALHGVPLDEAEALGLSPWLPPTRGFRRRREQGSPCLEGEARGARVRGHRRVVGHRRGEEFVRAALARYLKLREDVDASLEYRARRLFEVREFDGVRLPVAIGDEEELADAIAKVRRLRGYD